MARLRLQLLYKPDRVYPSRFQRDYYVLTSLTNQFKRLIPQYFGGFQEAILLDYGCGNMPYKQFFAPYVADYRGIDVPSHYDTGYEEQVDIFTDENGRVPAVTDNTAEIMFSNMVLEHVENPTLYLDECYRMLKPGGRMLIATLGYWPYHPYPEDYWRWMAPGLRRELTEAGFEVLHEEGMMGMLSISMQLLQEAFERKLPKFIIPYWIFIMQWLVQLTDKLYGPYKDNRDSATYTFVVQKPLTDANPTDEE